MALKYRNGRPIYYRSRKIGGKVVDDYVGSGVIAELAADTDESIREERKRRREAEERAQQRLTAVDKPVARLDRLTRTLAHATLLVAGFHSHKREWRKRSA